MFRLNVMLESLFRCKVSNALITLKSWWIVKWWCFICELLQAEWWWQRSQNIISPLSLLLIWTVNAPLVLALYSHSPHWKKIYLCFFRMWTLRFFPQEPLYSHSMIVYFHMALRCWFTITPMTIIPCTFMKELPVLPDLFRSFVYLSTNFTFKLNTLKFYSVILPHTLHWNS